MNTREIEDGFLSAALNQYAFDEIYYSYFGRSLDEFNGMPRPSKWMNRDLFLIQVLRRASVVLRLLWSYLFAYLFFLCRACIYLVKKRRIGHASCDGLGNSVAMAICDRSFDVMKQAIPGPERKLWLELPQGGVSKGLRGNEDEFLNCLSVVTSYQILYALIIAGAVHNAIRKNNNKNLIMQSYAALDWIIMLIAIDKISPRKVITAEHHDRWAVLADSYCSIKHRVGAKLDLVLVQHGKEHEQTYYEMRSGCKYKELPYRLKYVSEAYLYNSQQLRIFEENIFDFDRKLEEALRVNFYKFKLNTFETGCGGIVVLFVGHPLCEQLQVQLYRKISDRLGYHFFYKPHPTAKNRRAVNPGWFVVDDDSKFPRADLLISYPSTLVDEYREIGVDSFVHPLRADECDQESLAIELSKVLDSIGLNKSK